MKLQAAIFAYFSLSSCEIVLDRNISDRLFVLDKKEIKSIKSVTQKDLVTLGNYAIVLTPLPDLLLSSYPEQNP